MVVHLASVCIVGLYERTDFIIIRTIRKQVLDIKSIRHYLVPDNDNNSDTEVLKLLQATVTLPSVNLITH